MRSELLRRTPFGFWFDPLNPFPQARVAIGLHFSRSCRLASRSMGRSEHILDNPQHWLDRAEEIRAIAADMNDPDTKRLMLGIADGYDKLAERARERASKKSQ